MLAILSATIFLSENIYAQKHYADIRGNYGNSFGIGGGQYLERGYRGMVEFGNGFDFDEFWYSYEISTTHGYQFNRWLFLGGTFRYAEGADDLLSVAADIRTYFSDNRIAPFIGARLGTDWYFEWFLPYVSGNVGLRVGLIGKTALNVSISIDTGFDMSGGLLFKLGFEW